jgi:thiamine-phosphate pyrophosphorylase
MPLPARIGRLRLPVLSLVVGAQDAKNGDLESLVASAVAGGVTMVQLRDRAMPASQLLDTARRLKTITRGKALLIVNDRVDVAIAAEVDGAQLPEDGIPTLVARGLVGKYAVLGRSVHSTDAAIQAGREGAEYVVAGTIYKSPSKPDAKPAGPSLISDISKAVELPILAIGGITADKVEDVVKAGAAGVAVVSAITKAQDPKAAAEDLSKALLAAWSKRTEPIPAKA